MGLNKDVEMRFKTGLDELINEVKYHIKEHRREIRRLEKNDKYNIKLYDLEIELKIMIDDRDKFKFIKWNYDFIKFVLNRYENNIN